MTSLETVPPAAAGTSPFWSALPSMLWLVFALFFLLWFRIELSHVFRALASRLRSGAAFKLAGLEFGPESGLPAHAGGFSAEDSRVGVKQDDGQRERERDSAYEACRGVMPTHRLQRSTENGQLYDVLVYVIPHKSSLAGACSVEYFFGRFWGNKIFPSFDRSRGFAVMTSAYGPFLCTARVQFNDGHSVTLYRYIDFEMGGCAPHAQPMPT